MQNPVALAARPVRDLFLAAFLERANDVMVWLVQRVLSPGLLVLLARDGEGVFRGLAIVNGSIDVFMPAPLLLYFYASGDRYVAEQLSYGIEGWARELGHERVAELRTDPAQGEAALMANFLAPDLGRPVGSVVEYTIRPKE